MLVPKIKIKIRASLYSLQPNARGEEKEKKEKKEVEDRGVPVDRVALS